MIKLQPLKKENITPFFKWLNDEEVIQYSLTAFQNISTQEEIESWYSNVLHDTKNYTVGIFLKETNHLIGYAGICAISHENRSGEFFIFIGEKSHWGKGYGTITTHEIIKHGFENLNLNRIMLTVSEPNIAGIQAYEKAGFKKEGVLRKVCFRNGHFHDKIVMSILKEEWVTKQSESEERER